MNVNFDDKKPMAVLNWLPSRYEHLIVDCENMGNVDRLLLFKFPKRRALNHLCSWAMEVGQLLVVTDRYLLNVVKVQTIIANITVKTDAESKPVGVTTLMYDFYLHHQTILKSILKIPRLMNLLGNLALQLVMATQLFCLMLSIHAWWIK